MESCEHGQLTPEMEAEVVRQALKQGDLPHAAHHVAGCLAADPLRPDFMKLFDQVFDAADDPLEVFSFENQGWFGKAATHALALARLERHGEALAWLCQVAKVAPQVPYLAWVRSWPLPDHPQVMKAVSSLLHVYEPTTWRLALDTFLLRALRAQPDEAELSSLVSIGARRSGNIDEAIDIAQSSVRGCETWMGYVALANALKEKEDWSATEAAWENAIRLRPDDCSVLLDWGDTLLARDLPEEAAERFEQALSVEPDNTWARGSLLAIEYQQEPSTAKWAEIARFVRANPQSGNAAEAVRRAPWMGWLPFPMEATANSVKQAEEAGHVPSLITVSFLEGPSVQLALRQFAPDAEYTAEDVPTPDPRAPLLDDVVPLFEWDGAVATPALGPPSQEALALILELAGQRYDAAGWIELARQRVLGQPPELVDDLLRTAVHPPPKPEWARHHWWVWRCQHATAYLLASFPGWADALPHVAALRAMLSVRNDWTAVAAMAAITARAELEPELSMTGFALVSDILQSPPEDGAWSTGLPGWWAVLRLDLDNSLKLHDKASSWID